MAFTNCVSGDHQLWCVLAAFSMNLTGFFVTSKNNNKHKEIRGQRQRATKRIRETKDMSMVQAIITFALVFAFDKKMQPVPYHLFGIKKCLNHF